MSVTDQSETCGRDACILPSEDAPGCGCSNAMHTSAGTGGKIAGAATISALAAAACTSCCVLPFLLPAVILANIGGMLAILDHAHVWVTRAAMIVVACTWIWIWYQAAIGRRKPSRASMLWMTLATTLTLTAVSWPLIQPWVDQVLGIVRKVKG